MKIYIIFAKSCDGCGSLRFKATTTKPEKKDLDNIIDNENNYMGYCAKSIYVEAELDGDYVDSSMELELS